MVREIRTDPNTEGVHAWLRAHVTLPDEDREPLPSWWMTLKCPQCDHTSGHHLHAGQRREVCSCNYWTCDGAIMVLFDEPGVYDPTKTRVYAMGSTNQWVRIEHGIHPCVMGTESRTNPRWKTGDGLVLGGLTTSSDILPDGKERGVKDQIRKVCSCGWSTEWGRPQFGQYMEPGSIEDQARNHIHTTVDE